MSATMERSQKTAEPDKPGPGFVVRWFRQVPLTIGLLSLFAWFLPTLIAVTPLRNVVVNAASARLPHGIEVGSARLSWTGPVQLHDVRIPDDSGGSLLEVERIESEQSLWDLATESFTRALFHVFRPRLRITMKENSTAVDSSVLQLLDRHVGTGKPIALDLENGLITFVNERGDVLTEITDVTLMLEMTPGAVGGEGNLELAGRIVRDDGDGSLSLNAEWSSDDQGRTGHVVLDVERFPADALGPMLASRLDGRQIKGEVTGVVEADWHPDDGLLAGELQLDADRLVLELVSSTSDEQPDAVEALDEAAGEADVQRWEFRDSMIRSVGQYDAAGDRATLDEFIVDSELVSLSAAGEVSGIDTRPVIDLQGELTSDPEMLIAFLNEALPDALAIEDLSIRRFSASGPVSELATLYRKGPRDPVSSPGSDQGLEIAADVGWAAMDFHGVQSMNGLVNARLVDRELLLQPVEVIVSGGRVEQLPRLDLAVSPSVLVFPEGPIIQDVALTEETCRTWLKYISPLLADVTGVQGRFSVDSRGGSMPLHDPSDAALDGTMRIESGRVGPGPLARQIMGLVEQIQSLSEGQVAAIFGGARPRQRSWLELPEQDVEVRVADGRVHHDGMQYLADDVTVVTRGSVGLDDSLDVVLEIPLLDDWVEGNRYLASMKGETLEIPLRGTLDQPQIDPRAVNQLLEQMATRAGAGLLQQLLDR